MAINTRLAQIGAKRIGLVTPYVAALEVRIVEITRRPVSTWWRPSGWI